MTLQHVSVIVPVNGAEAARGFYGALLGLVERDVLPALDPSGYIWYRAGGEREIHLMLAEDPVPETKAHFCLSVRGGLDALRERLELHGVETRDGTSIEKRRRFTCHDPFGNLVELAELDT